MTRGEIAFAIISGLLVNEVTDICPWLAIRLVRWAARLRYPDAPERAATRGEEFAALINDRPGKLFKLFTALGFVLHALTVAGRRTVPRGAARITTSTIRFANDHRSGVWRIAAGSGTAFGILAPTAITPWSVATVQGVIMAMTAAMIMVMPVARVLDQVVARATDRPVAVNVFRTVAGVVCGVGLGTLIGIAVASAAVAVAWLAGVGLAVGLATVVERAVTRISGTPIGTFVATMTGTMTGAAFGAMAGTMFGAAFRVQAGTVPRVAVGAVFGAVIAFGGVAVGVAGLGGVRVRQD